MPMKNPKFTPGCAYLLGATPLAGGVNFSVFANKAVDEDLHDA